MPGYLVKKKVKTVSPVWFCVFILPILPTRWWFQPNWKILLYSKWKSSQISGSKIISQKNIWNHHLVPSLFSACLFVESKSSSIFFDATPRLHCHQNFLLPKDQQWRSANGLWEKVAPFVTPKPEHSPQFLVSLQRVYTMNSKICSIHVACMYVSKKNSNKIQQVLAKTSRLHIEVNKFKTFKGHSNSGFWVHAAGRQNPCQDTKNQL